MSGMDPVPENQSMADWLRTLRGDRTREEVAESIGISPTALEMYETARRVPRDEVKVALMQYYKVEASPFFARNIHEKCNKE